jgi:hypothetical protein
MDPQNCGSARNEKGMFTTTYPGKADTVNAAQMQSLGVGKSAEKKSAGPVEVWFLDAGYNPGGLKGCWNCGFRCDFTDDLEGHWQRRHSLRPDQTAVKSFSPPVATVDRVVGRTRQEVEIKIAALLQSRATMKEYLSLKYVENDMHGVQDAASDIRDIDAELVGLRWVLGDADGR